MCKATIRKAGFTLVELLLVVSIIGVVTAIVMPDFVKSMKGNRLRSAVRTVVSAGRYARSQAVLQQRDMALLFDMGKNTLSIHPVRLNFTGSNSRDGTFDSDDESEDDDAETSEAMMNLEAAKVERQLRMVKIASVEVDILDERFEAGAIPIIYRSNGTCMRYSVTIADEQGVSVTVHVDELSTAKTEGDR